MKPSRHSPPHEDGEGGHERWLVSYADFITLMFAFFAVLYATSQKDVEKSKEFQESIKRFLIKAGSFGESGAQINQGKVQNSPIESPIETFRPAKAESANGVDEAEAYLEKQLTEAERKKYVLDLAADEWGVRVVLPASSLFSERSEKFREDALPFLSKLGGLLAHTKRKVLIEGHVSPGETGSFRSSWDFASARAVNLLRFVQQKEKLKGDRLAAASFADTRPLEGVSQERSSRIEVVLLNTDMEF